MVGGGGGRDLKREMGRGYGRAFSHTGKTLKSEPWVGSWGWRD